MDDRSVVMSVMYNARRYFSLTSLRNARTRPRLTSLIGNGERVVWCSKVYVRVYGRDAVGVCNVGRGGRGAAAKR